MKFKAAILEQLKAPLVIDEVENLPLEAGQVLVRIAASGICGKQLVEIAGTLGPDRFLPHGLGHEAGCEVIGVGAGVRNVKPGDRCVAHWRKGVGIDAAPAKYKRAGGFVGVGPITTFSEYSVVSENRLTTIPEDIPFDIAALFGCAVCTGLGLVTNEARLRIGESVAVLGAGGVGLNVVQAAAIAGAYPIVAIDINSSKLQLAMELGATHGINVEPDHDGSVLRHCLGAAVPHGVDLFVETTGVPHLIERAFSLTAPGGRLFLVGQMRHDQKISFNTLAMHAGRTMIASDGGATVPHVDIPRYLRLYSSGKLKLDRLITHRAPLEQINTLLDQVRAGRVGRAVIEMGNN